MAGDSLAAIEADILDTHFDDCKVAVDEETGAREFKCEPTTTGEGYVRDEPIMWSLKEWVWTNPDDHEAGGAWGPDLPKMQKPHAWVLKGDANACGMSCHNEHDGAWLARASYALSNHGDPNGEALHHFFSRPECSQCHSGAGFARFTDHSNPNFDAETGLITGYVSPKYDGDRDYPADMITCNTCHDGTGLPTSKDKRLRITGKVLMKGGSGGPPPNTLYTDGVVDAGTSASCLVCHQARQSGGSTYKTIVKAGRDPWDPADDVTETGEPNPMTGITAVDSHYAVGGATLYSLKAYEYPCKTYTPGNIFHQAVSCVGCHMSESDDLGIGGHSMHVGHRGDVSQNKTCLSCHGEIERASQIGPYIDVDGDGTAESRRTELNDLIHDIFVELENQGIYYNTDKYPYWFNTPDTSQHRPGPAQNKSWTESQLTAAFNAFFFKHDPGISTHNFIYGAQALRDSMEALTGTKMRGVRPSTPYDRPATDYSGKGGPTCD